MIAELEGHGTKLMVSIWPTIDKTSTHFEDMRARGLLVRTHRGIATTMDFLGDTVFFDATQSGGARLHLAAGQSELL